MTRPRRRSHAPFTDEISDIEKERHALKVFENILHERDELLGHHEKKVVALKEDYEKRLAELEEREANVTKHEARLQAAVSHEKAALKDFERVERDLQKAESHLKEIQKTIQDLRTTEAKLQIDLSRKMREAKLAQKKFDKIHASVDRMSKEKEKLTEELEHLDSLKVMKRTELTHLSEEIGRAKLLHRQARSKSYRETEKDLKAAMRQVKRALKKKDLARAHKEYERVREIYQSLTPVERKIWYEKIVAVAKSVR